MTKDELAALTQDAFELADEKHYFGHHDEVWCCECKVVIGPTPHYHPKDKATKITNALCPACWAKRPPAWPQFELWDDNRPAKDIFRFFGSGPGEWAWIAPKYPKPQKANGKSAFGGHKPRKHVAEPQARAYAAEHGIAWPDAWGPAPKAAPIYGKWHGNQISRTMDEKAYEWVGRGHATPTKSVGWANSLRDGQEVCGEDAARAMVAEWGNPWPDAWGPAEAEGDGWEYGMDTRDGMAYRWRPWAAMGECEVRSVSSPDAWHNCGLIPEQHQDCLDGKLDKRTCTLAEAKANLEAHGGSWPEEPSEPKPTPEPDAKPVGYSCKDCGGMLAHFVDGDPRLVRTCGCADSPADQTSYIGAKLPSWVQPGPPPGPWEKSFVWIGAFRPPLKGEDYLSGPGVPQACENHSESDGPRHILRPKPAEEWPKWFRRTATGWFRRCDSEDTEAVTFDVDGTEVECGVTCKYGFYAPDAGFTPISPADLPWVQAPEPPQRPGEQCRGCGHEHVDDHIGHHCNGQSPDYLTACDTANPANDCEHYKAAEGGYLVPKHLAAEIETKLTPSRKDTPMETPTRKRSLITRALIASGKGLGFWALKTLLTGGAALLVYHNLGTCWAFVNDPGAVLQPAWDATAAFAGRHWPLAMGCVIASASVFLRRKQA